MSFRDRLKDSLRVLLRGRQALQAPAPKARMRAKLGEVIEHLATHGLAPATVIDVGFNTGTEGLYDRFPDAHYVMVDPLDESRPFLEAQKVRLRRADFVVAAAGPKAGSCEVGVSPCFGGTSQYLKDKLPSRVVPMVTLDELALRFGCTGPYLLKVDVQGAELDVLRGAEKILSQTEAILAETRLFPFQGAPEILEVLKFLEARGFVLFDLFNPLLRPSDGALGQIDIVAVKRDGTFRDATAYKTSRTFRTGDQRRKNVESKLKRRETELAKLSSPPPPPSP